MWTPKHRHQTYSIKCTAVDYSQQVKLAVQLKLTWFPWISGLLHWALRNIWTIFCFKLTLSYILIHNIWRITRRRCTQKTYLKLLSYMYLSQKWIFKNTRKRGHSAGKWVVLKALCTLPGWFWMLSVLTNSCCSDAVSLESCTWSFEDQSWPLILLFWVVGRLHLCWVGWVERMYPLGLSPSLLKQNCSTVHIIYNLFLL